MHFNCILYCIVFVCFALFAVSTGSKDSPNGAITDGNHVQKHILPTTVDLCQTTKDNEVLGFSEPDSSTGSMAMEGEADMLVHVSQNHRQLKKL